MEFKGFRLGKVFWGDKSGGPQLSDAYDESNTPTVVMEKIKNDYTFILILYD